MQALFCALNDLEEENIADERLHLLRKEFLSTSIMVSEVILQCYNFFFLILSYNYQQVTGMLFTLLRVQEIRLVMGI